MMIITMSTIRILKTKHNLFPRATIRIKMDTLRMELIKSIRNGKILRCTPLRLTLKTSIRLQPMGKRTIIPKIRPSCRGVTTLEWLELWVIKPQNSLGLNQNSLEIQCRRQIQSIKTMIEEIVMDTLQSNSWLQTMKLTWLPTMIK